MAFLYYQTSGNCHGVELASASVPCSDDRLASQLRFMFQSGIISTSDKLLKESKSTQRRGPTSGSNSSKGWAMGQVRRREEKKSYVQPNTA